MSRYTPTPLYFDDTESEIKGKHQRVEAAALRYKDFFQDLKYSDFMKVVRISLKQIREAIYNNTFKIFST